MGCYRDTPFQMELGLDSDDVGFLGSSLPGATMFVWETVDDINPALPIIRNIPQFP